ncbi:MAG: LPS export ABC transporter permease LptG [Halioglobus sp.]|nr:LPS export ABC transporter permease LptG [Halioglobus sp.]
MILQRYIAWNLLKGWLLVLLVLGAVFGLIAYIDQLEQTRLEYDALAAALYTLLTLPNQLVALAPVIALLGTIVALASMDRCNELTIISCTGFALRKLLGAVLLPTFLLMLLLWALMEYAAPQMQQTAEHRRHEQRFGGDAWISGSGIWSTDGLRYINLRSLSSDGEPGNISLFEFNKQGELTRSLRALRAEVDNDRRWHFHNAHEKRLENGLLVTRQHKEKFTVENLWSKSELPSLTLDAESMALSVLYNYTRYRQSNNQPSAKYANTYWQKLLMPITVFAMVLLATPISARISAGRDRSFGFNLGIGALVGIFFYLGTQIIYATGQILELSIPLVALAPAIIIGCVALLLLRRMRW